MAQVSPDDWIRAGLTRLRHHGIEAVRVEPLARELGVTKGSFYWHFRDRPALLDAMLARWVENATDAVIREADEAGDAAEDRLRRLTRIATADFDGEFELALREWGRRDPAVERALTRVAERRLGYLRSLLRDAGHPPAEAEARAFLLYSALLGHHLLPEAHGRISRRRVLRESLELLLGR